MKKYLVAALITLSGLSAFAEPVLNCQITSGDTHNAEPLRMEARFQVENYSSVDLSTIMLSNPEVRMKGLLAAYRSDEQANVRVRLSGDGKGSRQTVNQISEHQSVDTANQRVFLQLECFATLN